MKETAAAVYYSVTVFLFRYILEVICGTLPFIVFIACHFEYYCNKNKTIIVWLSFFFFLFLFLFLFCCSGKTEHFIHNSSQGEDTWTGVYSTQDIQGYWYILWRPDKLRQYWDESGPLSSYLNLPFKNNCCLPPTHKASCVLCKMACVAHLTLLILCDLCVRNVGWSTSSLGWRNRKW